MIRRIFKMNTSRILAFTKSKKLSSEELNKISGGYSTFFATDYLGPNREPLFDVGTD